MKEWPLKLRDVKDILDAEVIVGEENLDMEVKQPSGLT